MMCLCLKWRKKKKKKSRKRGDNSVLYVKCGYKVAGNLGATEEE